MRGEEYDDLQIFVSACKRNRTELDAGSVLGKMYKVDVLREIANEIDIDISDAEGAGRIITYSTAEIISDSSSNDILGDKLSEKDHGLNYPILTYYQLPNSNGAFSSFKKFKKALNRKKNIELDNDYWQGFNALTDPPPHNCMLESVAANKDEQYFSLLFSCSRALVLPRRTMSDHKNLFLSRVPVLVRIFFDSGLVEFSMPTYSEPIAGEFSYEYQAPKRYQQTFESAYKVLRSISDEPLVQIRYSELPRWFEQKYSAIDMGWKIVPRDDADFDLTQNYIPLKDIIDGFMSSLDIRCASMGRVHKLEGIDLYHVFRSLQNESHTHTMVQRVPFGARKGGLILTAFFGSKQAMYYPVILLDSTPSDIMVNNLRTAIMELRSAVIDDTYSINSLLVDEN